MTGTTLEALLNGTLEADAFSHRDHIIVAYEALERADFFTALGQIADGLARLATDYEGAEDFVRRNPDLLTGAPLKRHYSSARLTSDISRQVALLPDLSPAS